MLDKKSKKRKKKLTVCRKKNGRGILYRTINHFLVAFCIVFLNFLYLLRIFVLLVNFISLRSYVSPSLLKKKLIIKFFFLKKKLEIMLIFKNKFFYITALYLQ